jgi:hypothetical protein
MILYTNLFLNIEPELYIWDQLYITCSQCIIFPYIFEIDLLVFKIFCFYVYDVDSL